MLNGKDILLRPMTVEDAQVLADWSSDPTFLGEFYNIWPETRAMVEGRLADRERLGRDQRGDFFIYGIDKDEKMGVIGYFNPFTLKFCRGLEIFYMIHPEFRNKGIGTQATCLLINHLFNATTIERIQATVVVGNEASCRVLEKAGMQKEGIYRRVFFLRGRYVNLHLYSIVREDWKNETSYRQGRAEF